MNLAEKYMQEQINKAIILLRNNGYGVYKFTESMQADADECERLDGSKDCFGCSCNRCVAGCVWRVKYGL